MKKIFVTQPSLPPLKEYIPYLEEIWNSKFVTNQGTFHKQFERELEEYLGVKNVSLFTNGTIALVVALQVLRITGQVITTPYSFVATTHALQWNGITPVFCDIKREDCNIDSEKIESLITPKTTAIMPVHVYGNPCDTEKIQEIADMYGLKVIYDAAHAFGVEKNDISILNAGDLSVLSFHGTKPFQTAEGGAIICHDEKLKKRIDYAKNFGFAGETTVVMPGINGKMNEMQAALGLLQLKYYNKYIESRKKCYQYYLENLKEIPGLTFLMLKSNFKNNYPYFPIFIDKKIFGKSRDELYEVLKESNVFSRRYFYPLISEFPAYKDLSTAEPSKLPIAKEISEKVLCLPLYSELTEETQNFIINIIKKTHS